MCGVRCTRTTRVALSLRSEFELTSSSYVGPSTLQFTNMNLSDNLGGHYSLYCNLPDHDVSYTVFERTRTWPSGTEL